MLSRLYKGDGWGGLISTANQTFNKKLRQISHDESPGGAAERSPARECWECPDFANKPRRGDTLWRPRTIEPWSRVSPLRGLSAPSARFPGLAPWATIFRAYGAPYGEGRRSTALFQQEFSYGGVFRQADGLVKGVRSLSSFSKLSEEVGANRPVWLVLRYSF
jgi:hypothetical protein